MDRLIIKQRAAMAEAVHMAAAGARRTAAVRAGAAMEAVEAALGMGMALAETAVPASASSNIWRREPWQNIFD